MTIVYHAQSQRHPTKVWLSLVKTCLPPQDRDIEFWWQLTGYHLANMVEAAGYSVERQYEVLLFHYHWIVSIPLLRLSAVVHHLTL